VGNLLDHYQATQGAQKAPVDKTEQDKEKAVEEAASLERDIDTLANTFGQTCTVSLLGPILHVNHVADEAKRELKIEVIHKDGFVYLVEMPGGKASTYPANKFYPFMIDWIKGNGRGGVS
jgi:hypothetical protein